MRAIDLFAGAGGSSTGMAQAGWNVVWAANHWPLAVQVHELNHQNTQHAVQDLHQFAFSECPDHDVLWASPSCKGHSQAASGGGLYKTRGSAPSHDALRSTAFAALTAAEVNRPEVCIIENVEQFRCGVWELYEVWLSGWKALGYHVTESVINSVDVGVPQERPRLFVVATRKPFELGQPTGYPVRTMANVMRPDEGKWKPVSKAADGVKARVKRAIERYDYRDVFHTQSVRDNYGRSLDRPSPVVTTKHQMGLVRGNGPWDKREYRPLLLSEYKALMGFPNSYDLGNVGVSKGAVLMGNAVCPPVAKWIAEQVQTRYFGGA